MKHFKFELLYRVIGWLLSRLYRLNLQKIPPKTFQFLRYRLRFGFGLTVFNRLCEAFINKLQQFVAVAVIWRSTCFPRPSLQFESLVSLVSLDNFKGPLAWGQLCPAKFQRISCCPGCAGGHAPFPQVWSKDGIRVLLPCSNCWVLTRSLRDSWVIPE